MDNGKMMLDIAHLIDRKCVERYHNKFATTSAMMRDCQMQLSGPWPPYHFVHRLTRTIMHGAGATVCCGSGSGPGGRCVGAGRCTRLAQPSFPSTEKLQLRLELFFFRDLVSRKRICHGLI